MVRRAGPEVVVRYVSDKCDRGVGGGVGASEDGGGE